MRLAFLTHEPFYPPSGGGSAEAIYLVEEMVRRGHQVHLFCPRLEEPVQVRQRFDVVLHEFNQWEMGRYTSLRTPKYLLYPSFLARMVRGAAEWQRFDLIFSQHSIAAVAAGRLRRSGTPVVMNFLDFLTGFMETWPPWLAPPPLLSLLKRYELSLPRRFGADGVLTISDEFTSLLVRDGYPRSQIQPIYFGFDAALFPDPAGSNPGPPAGAPPVVVMHGSLDHHHLGPVALAAVAEVARVRPETIFRFIGRETPALRKFKEQAARFHPAPRVECTGFVPYAEIGPRLAEATVGIVPYEESSGVHCAFVAKAVEYLAVGLPVVSTSLRSIQSYFRNEPLIRFAGFDGRAFAQAILDWLREPPETRRQLGPAASRRVRAELDWRAISRKAVDFAEKIAGRARADAASVSPA